MRISAPYLEIRAPKVEKSGACYTKRMRNFFPFWLVHSLSEVLLACKILDGGVTPCSRYGEKTGFAILNIARCNAYSPRPVSHYGCPAAAVRLEADSAVLHRLASLQPVTGVIGYHLYQSVYRSVVSDFVGLHNRTQKVTVLERCIQPRFVVLLQTVHTGRPMFS